MVEYKTLIRRFRQVLGSQETVAAMLGVSVRTISRWETGNSRASKLAVQQLAAKLFNKIGQLPSEAAGRKFTQLGMKATGVVYNLIKTGKLPCLSMRPYTGRKESNRTVKCSDCDDYASEYDHRDYFKPEEVDPVCRSCNHSRGPALNTFLDHPKFWSRYSWKWPKLKMEWNPK